jgi:hypothetical protein
MENGYGGLDCGVVNWSDANAANQPNIREIIVTHDEGRKSKLDISGFVLINVPRVDGDSWHKVECYYGGDSDLRLWWLQTHLL